MKRMILILLGLSFYSCSVKEDGKLDNDLRYNGGLWTSVEYDFKEVEIDSCEYIVIYGADGRNIIHKANCKNSFHNCND